MTLPLVVLAFFSITAGWSGIEEGFPLFGGIGAKLDARFCWGNTR